MRIGIIGAGAIGSALARLASASGHDVAIANRRGPQSLQPLIEDLGGSARADTVEGVAQFGDVVFEALPFAAYTSLPADALKGKVVVSASNYYAGRDGAIDLGDRVDTELVAEHLAHSRVVKAFNTIWSQHLATQGDRTAELAARRVIFLAGDDQAAVDTAAGLARDFGFGPCATGTLHEGGRVQQPGSPLYNVDLTLAQGQVALDQLRA